MKKIIIIFLVLILFSVVGCADVTNIAKNPVGIGGIDGSLNTTPDTPTPDTPTPDTPTPDTPTPDTPTPDTPTPSLPEDETSVVGNFEYGLVEDVEDGSILHAWNWSMKDIKNNMQSIASAGYSTVQTSVMQPQKDYMGKQAWANAWWKLYQPLGFSVAKEGENALGTADDLKAVCDEAKKYGVKIIVDVVANHLAGSSNTKIYDEVEKYEPVIYKQNLIHKNGYANDGSANSVVQGSIGEYVDLQTENKIVQNRVLSLLKEYIDLGVSGFRFDAAKHIETQEDGACASDFWPTVLGGASTYFQTVNKTQDTPYYYGEILNTVGNGRSYTYYTKNMYITNNGFSRNLLNCVQNSSISVGNLTPTGDLNTSNSVVWGESHDTYANDSHETTNINQIIIDKTYAIETALDIVSLYFARPTDVSTVGSIGKTAYMSPAITAINQFDNYFNTGDVKSSVSNNNVYIQRTMGTEKGMAIISLGTKVSINNVSTNLTDGTYYDKVSNNEFVVANGFLSGTGDDSGIVVLQSNSINVAPIINVDYNSWIFNDSVDVSISCLNTQTATYQINNETAVSFDSKTKFRMGEDCEYGLITLKITATNAGGKVEKTITFKKVDPNNLEITVKNIDVSSVSGKTIYAWVWEHGQDGRWVSGKLVGTTFTFTKKSSETHFLLAAFAPGVTPSWNKTTQTKDIAINGESEFDFTGVVWKTSL